MKEKIEQLALQIYSRLIDYRRHFHMNPELSLKEFKTAEFIKGLLKEWEIPFTSEVAITGIVAHIKGKKEGNKTIALRADMDALPIIEENTHSFISQNEGVMHACGHDVHMASLLGAAWILNQIKEEFGGTIRLIFQPSEEQYPGGAFLMIKEGVLENPTPEAIFGQHVLPDLPVGMVGFKPGKYMASTDEIYLTVKGHGGHAAQPEKNIDPIVIASQIIVALQQIVSRNTPPLIPCVLSFGKFIANGRTNIIPDEAKIEGTIRTFSEPWRAEAHELIKRTASGIATALGGECEVFIDKGYPYVVNDEPLTLQAKEYAIEYLGADKVIDLEERMTAEDFAYYSQVIPGCFYRLGVRNEEKGMIYGLHNSRFDADEQSLAVGAGLMAWLAFRKLSSLS